MKIKIKGAILGILFTAVAVNAYAAVAEVSKVKGRVEMQSSVAGDWKAVENSAELESGDLLRTGPSGEATINFNSGHTAQLGPEANMTISEATSDNTEIDLFKGKLRSKVKKLTKGQDYSIKTPQAVCAVRGTEFEVSLVDERTSVQVFEGRVEARELVTGEAVEISAGQYSSITSGSKPEEPKNIDAPDEEESQKETKKTESATDVSNIREEIRSEMFEEISREAVLSRAAEEIKRAEYENGKAMIDAHGNRVQLEEYVVRPAGIDNEFKYVVLNKRDERFDFGKINFTFDSSLPTDLTLATKEMFYSESATKPEYILTDLTSVMSNTKDRVNEVAANGDMLQDSSDNWNHYFGSYEFSIKGEGRDEVTLWAETASNTGGAYDDLSFSKEYLEDPSVSKPESETKSPSGTDSFHRYAKDTYSDGTWISAEDWLIDDDGNVQTSGDIQDSFSSEIGGSFKDYLAKLNFERKYKSSEFGDRDIDLVFSTKLLLDSGMLSMGIE